MTQRCAFCLRAQATPHKFDCLHEGIVLSMHSFEDDRYIADINRRARQVANQGRGQSKRHSWYETLTGTSTGFVGSLLITLAVFKYVPGTLEFKALINTMACTVWSIVRGYYNRRFWNWMR